MSGFAEGLISGVVGAGAGFGKGVAEVGEIEAKANAAKTLKEQEAEIDRQKLLNVQAFQEKLTKEGQVFQSAQTDKTIGATREENALNRTQQTEQFNKNYDLNVKQFDVTIQKMNQQTLLEQKKLNHMLKSETNAENRARGSALSTSMSELQKELHNDMLAYPSATPEQQSIMEREMKSKAAELQRMRSISNNYTLTGNFEAPSVKPPSTANPADFLPKAKPATDVKPSDKPATPQPSGGLISQSTKTNNTNTPPLIQRLRNGQSLSDSELNDAERFTGLTAQDRAQIKRVADANRAARWK